VLVLAEMHLNPDEVGLAATEMMVPAEMHLRPDEVHLAAAETMLPATRL
jgi:hypothetical protein